jgi:CDP-diacylglycerol--glycerol-3-phosphate 3-phosphatidyltransferase|tara:strand:+ start:309 stop:893 length:585 start_codon:yes stop_codon:yes gene_type:complete
MSKITEIKKRYMNNPSKVLTLANTISLLRAAAAIPIIYTLNYPDLRAVTAGIVILAILSDALDGYFARKAGEVTHVGMWLDPIADFIVITSIVLFLVIMDLFPLWFFCFYIIRHFMIAVPALYFVNTGQYILHSNWWGKWTTGITTLTVFLHIFEFPDIWWLKPFTLYSALILALISWLIYYRDYYNVIRGRDA